MAIFTYRTPEDNLIQKFDPSGHVVSGWGVSGQKDGTDAVPENPFHFRNVSGIDVNPSGELYVHDPLGSYYVFIFAPNGNFLRYAGHSEFAGAVNHPGGFKLDPAGNFYETSNIKYPHTCCSTQRTRRSSRTLILATPSGPSR